MLTEHCKYSTLTKTVPSRNVSVNIKIGCQELQSIGYVVGKLEELDDTDPWNDPRLRATRRRCKKRRLKHSCEAIVLACLDGTFSRTHS